MPASDRFPWLTWLIAQPPEKFDRWSTGEKLYPQLLPLSVNAASGGVWVSSLRSMCPISGFSTASPPCGSHMRAALL